VQEIQREERLGERKGEAIVKLSAEVGRGEKIKRQGKKRMHILEHIFRSI
jgi:hypothetical protein